VHQAAGVARRLSTVAGAVLCVAGAGIVALQGPSLVAHWSYLAAVAALSAGMLLLWRCRPDGGILLLLIALGLVARLCFLRFPLSDDVNRYLWEGLIQAYGFDPFTTPPDSPRLAFLRGPLWEGINHREWTTIYWPLAQSLFRLAASSDRPRMAWRLLVLLMDAGVMAFVLLTLRALRRPACHALLYWLNPLVLVFTAGEAHVEVAGVLLLSAALWARLTGRPVLMYTLAAAAVMVKVSLVIAVPLLAERRTLRYAWTCAVPLALFALFPHGAPRALDTPFRFAAEFSHNGLAYILLDAICSPCARPVTFGFLAGVLALIFFLDTNPWHALRSGLAAFLVFCPTVHPWYFLLLTPLLCLGPAPSWLALHLTSLPLAFCFAPAARGTVWADRTLLYAAEYTPFVLIALGGLVWRLRSAPRPACPLPTVSVVIPTLNERRTIHQCIDTVRCQCGEAQIVGADGGSTDGTPEAAASVDRVEVVRAPRGRGPQIQAGVRRCTGDIVMIVHADSQLRAGAVPRMAAIMAADTAIVGGAFGARYDNPSWRFRITELLNNLRAVLFGITFGDQVQFFRRGLSEVVPPYVLLEDVEISCRLQQHGRSVFIPHGVTASTRRWREHGFAANFARVIGLTSLFLVKRRLGLLSADCREFYRRYYGSEA